jgi:vitamin B12 transporter
MLRVACVAALVLAGLGLGAEESGGIYDLGEVRVEAAASPLALAPAGSIDVISEKEIGASGASTAADLVEGRVGSFVSALGAAGALASPSLRGSSANQVLLIVDGVRWNDARQGGADLSSIPAQTIERIEILRGGASATYGPDALGGVIVVTTKRAAPGALSIAAENRSYPGSVVAGKVLGIVDEQGVSADAGFRAGLAEVSIAASATRAANAFPYGAAAGGTAFREHSAQEGGQASIGARMPAGPGMARAAISGSYRRLEVPGLASSPVEAEQGNLGMGGSLGWSSDALASGDLFLDAGFHAGWSRLTYDDPDAFFPSHDIHILADVGFDLRSSYILGEGLDLGAGLSALYEAADSTAFVASAGGQPSRLSVGAYLAPTFVLAERLKLVPALRYDWNDDYPAGLSGSAGLIWRPLDALELRLTGGNSYRAPTFNELFWPYEAAWNYVGNPELRPETAWTGELGALVGLGGLELGLSAFARYVDDLIVYGNDGIHDTMLNMQTALVPGVDASFEFESGPFRLAADYQFLYPLNLTGGKAISEAARILSMSTHKADLKAGLSFPSWEAAAEARWWSDRVVSAGELAGAIVVDVRGTLSLGGGFSLSLAAENLLDARYETQAGYPMPGLSIKTALRAKL